MVWFYHLFVVDYGKFAQFVDNTCKHLKSLRSRLCSSCPAALMDSLPLVGPRGSDCYRRLPDFQSRQSVQVERKQQVDLGLGHPIHVSTSPVHSKIGGRD